MYDYVIVGAGSAGCVLAHRLTEDPATTVLLLEAGGRDSRQEVAIPAAFPKLFQGPQDWAYETAPQPGLGGRRLFWPRGKMLGGSSAMNAMIYARGHRHDYDAWADGGATGWEFAEVLPYFKRAEHQERGASAYHGVGGPLNVADLRSLNPLSRSFVAAAAEVGLPATDDFNGPEQEGSGYYQVTQRRGQRHSASMAYLRPAANRPNLSVLTDAQATRVLVERDRAVGVAYWREGRSGEARAAREVILCGGTINSPQLLLLSGIGPADQLRAHGIPVLADLPGVGENVQDHLLAVVAHHCVAPVSLASAERPRHILDYLIRRRGPLTSNIAEAGAFVRTSPAQAMPDVQFLFAPVYFLQHGSQNPPGHGFSLGVTGLRPRSRGRIALRSADPSAPPLIDPHYLSDEEDLRLLVAGVKLARTVIAARPFDRYRGGELWPGPEARDDGAIAAALRQQLETLYHPVGSCKMGVDDLAVVDPRLRVYGVEGLRVVDASIMPTITGGNTNAPTMMIAERAADLIKEDAARGTAAVRRNSPREVTRADDRVAARR